MMSKESALEMMTFIERFGAAFNDATVATLSMEDAEEAKRVRRVLASMVAASFELSEIVVQQYPELKAPVAQ